MSSEAAWRRPPRQPPSCSPHSPGAVGATNPNEDPTDPGAVAKTYLRAVADGDGDKACAQLTTAVGKAAVKLASTSYPKDQINSCPAAIARLSKENDKASAELLRSARLNQLTVNGKTASVKSTASGTLKLTRSGSRWLISAGVYR